MKKTSVIKFKNYMAVPLLTVVVLILLHSCSGRNYFVAEVENPRYHPNKAFESFDDMATPQTEHLIAKFNLDTIFKGETDEFKRVLLLRHWIKSVIAIKDYAPFYPGEGNVERILDFALQGQGYDCGYFMKVQNAIMSSFGYVSRTLGAGPGVKDIRDGHHGINEIWLNQYNKWFLSDAKYDHHFEKDGIPLSALEVRNEYLKNEGADILMVKGPERISIDFDDEMQRTKKEFAQTYTWVTWDVYNSQFTTWPKHRTLLIMYEDDYYKNNVWYRGGKPAWLYAQPDYLKLLQLEEEIYFTPNTIASEVAINKNKAHIKLNSDTPNLKEYQFKKQQGDNWSSVEPEFEIDLKNRKYELVFRAVNLAGVAGPEHRIIIDSN
jgi:hypothetical protein